MFAPNHHPAMKNVAPVRKELGIKTIFNILGPLTNPAGAPNILMGVFHPDLVGIQVRALQRLGAEHALVVYGRDGMDEISLGAATMVGELKNGEVREYELHPEDFGFADVEQPRAARRDAGAVEGDAAGRARQPARRRRATSCCSTPARRSTRPTWWTRSATGIERARAAIDSGAAKAKLAELVKATARRRRESRERMSDILEKIVAVKREEIAAAQEAKLAGSRALRRRKPRAHARLRRRAARARSRPARPR